MRERLISLIVRSLLAALIAWVLASAPLPMIPASKWFAFIQVPLVVFVLLCYIGKLLIDTFFYDHYQP